MSRYPQLEPALNPRGQLKLILFLLISTVCHFGGVFHRLDYNFSQIFDDDKAGAAFLLLFGVSVIQMAWLALFNHLFRQPILRYGLVGAAMELLALAGAGFICWIEPAARGGSRMASEEGLSEFVLASWSNGTINLFNRLHNESETWAILIYPACVAVCLAMLLEYAAGEYQRSANTQKKSADLLDDL